MDKIALQQAPSNLCPKWVIRVDLGLSAPRLLFTDRVQPGDIAAGLLCANRDHSHRTKRQAYSITSSARASSAGGTVMPSALAVFMLMTSSYLVGACTGRSAGFSPLRMRST
jgi:hypothetical protein